MIEQENTNEVPLSLDAGTLLKSKRESLGMTQKQVADRLRLRVSVVEDIENNRFESQQVATFTRGYLRSYAKLVGIDEKSVLSALEQHSEVHVHQQETEMQSFSRKTKHEKHNSRIMLITWLIAIVIVGISGAWWWQNQQEDSLNATVSESQVETELDATEVVELEPVSTEEVAVGAPAEIASQAIESEIQQSTAPASAVDASQVEVTEAVTNQLPNAVDSSSEPEITTPNVEPVSSVVVPDGMTLLTMAFESDCWVQVKDANGRTLVSGTRKSGQNVELTGKAPFKVILGAPEGVSMTFASEPVDLSGYTSGKVARFTLPL